MVSHAILLGVHHKWEALSTPLILSIILQSSG